MAKKLNYRFGIQQDKRDSGLSHEATTEEQQELSWSTTSPGKGTELWGGWLSLGGTALGCSQALGVSGGAGSCGVLLPHLVSTPQCSRSCRWDTGNDVSGFPWLISLLMSLRNSHFRLFTFQPVTACAEAGLKKCLYR